MAILKLKIKELEISNNLNSENLKLNNIQTPNNKYQISRINQFLNFLCLAKIISECILIGYFTIKLISNSFVT